VGLSVGLLEIWLQFQNQKKTNYNAIFLFYVNLESMIGFKILLIIGGVKFIFIVSRSTFYLFKIKIKFVNKLKTYYFDMKYCYTYNIQKRPQ